MSLLCQADSHSSTTTGLSLRLNVPNTTRPQFGQSIQLLGCDVGDRQLAFCVIEVQYEQYLPTSTTPFASGATPLPALSQLPSGSLSCCVDSQNKQPRNSVNEPHETLGAGNRFTARDTDMNAIDPRPTSLYHQVFGDDRATGESSVFYRDTKMCNAQQQPLILQQGLFPARAPDDPFVRMQGQTPQQHNSQGQSVCNSDGSDHPSSAHPQSLSKCPRNPYQFMDNAHSGGASLAHLLYGLVTPQTTGFTSI